MTEENADVAIKTYAPHNKRNTACDDYIETMKELHVNLAYATRYLVQLFYQTGQKYSCTRTKIGKLLSIVAFAYARKGEQVFDEKIYKYDGCGTAIKELLSIIEDRDVYLRFNYQDDQKFITDNLSVVISEYITTDVQQTIEFVFRKFGSYSAKQLGECINVLVEQEHLLCDDDSINLSKIHLLNYKSLKTKNAPKDLIDFLIEFTK